MRLLLQCSWGSALVLLSASIIQAADAPRWIWGDGQRDGENCVALQTTLPASEDAQKVTLWLANAYCDCEIFLNGQSVNRIRPFHPPSSLVLKLRQGENKLGFVCRGVAGPSALAARLEVNKTSVISDTSWQVSELTRPIGQWGDLANATWARATSWGLLSERTWRSVGVTTHVADDYTQWKRALEQTGSTEADQLWTQPGFQVERLYSAGEGDGSWISLAEDPQGRWVIGHEDEGLVRITLQKNGTPQLEPVNVPVSECRGLVFAHDSLYAMANKNLSLFRLRDTNHDDQFDKIEVLKKFSGGTGHGRNQLTLGPDGKLYAIFGDSVDQPVDAKYLPPVVPNPDHVQKTHNGFVARSDARGENWEVVVRGLRNPYGLDFNAAGDLFTYDADAEYDMGSSWYRPTRVLHLLPGGDYGWRRVTKQWPPYNPDTASIPQPTLDIGRGSPTAVEFATGNNFPAAYRDTLFVLDWSYGRILAVHWQPCGSSYVGATEVFLRGSPLNVTDVEFGRDGAMYFVTGGRKTQSGLYRVRYVGEQNSASQRSSQQVEVARHAKSARALRRQLESLRGNASANTLAKAWKHLDASDPWIRHAARTIIETLPVKMWRMRALEETNIDRFLSAALALQRFGDDRDRQQLGQRLAAFEAHRLLSWQQFEWADLALRQLAGSDTNDSKWDPLFNELRKVFPSNHFLLDQQASRLLAKRNHGWLVPRAVKLLEKSRDTGNQRQQMHWLFILSTQSQGWTPELGERFFSGLFEMDSFEAGEGMATFRRLIRDAALANLPEELRDSWKQRFSKQAAQLLPELPPARSVIVRQWSMKDFQGLVQDLAKDRDPQRGRKMFATARCVVCHRVGREGGVRGPDLTSVAGRFSARDLLTSILKPSAVISQKYASTIFELSDGRLLSGHTLVTDFRAPNIELIPDPLAPHKTVSFSKQEIVERRTSPISPMPKGLVDGLEKQEILDLLAYLLAK
jgi:putative heme-binding domain-containing protein